METFVILLHILIAVAIIAFVLLQQGKGAEAGASFGAGASQTLFGSAGSWNFFSRVTAVLALLFFLTSFGLAVLAKNKADGDDVLTPELKMLEDAARTTEEIPPVKPGSSEIPEPAAAATADNGNGNGAVGDRAPTKEAERSGKSVKDGAGVPENPATN